jgi:predicted peptidase
VWKKADGTRALVQPSAADDANFLTRQMALLPHLTFLPRSYSETGVDQWPLMLFLHGAGERGSDLRTLRRYGPPRIVESDPDFPFILIAPQCPTGSYWRPAALLALLDDAAARYRIDPRRFVVTGVSMGGYGTWELATTAPARLAAIAPICGGGEPRRAPVLAGVSVWAFHGEEDDIVPVSETLEMIDAIRSAGGNPRVTIYPGVAHESWGAAYATAELYQWLLAQRARG